MSENNDLFHLLPYTQEDLLVGQNAMQTMGWHITAFNLPEVWKITQGENVTVAIIDTGCDLTHPDLVSNLVEGKNFVEPNMPPEDSSNHGTHIAGILAANNDDFGVVGVSPKTKIMPLKVLNSYGIGTPDAIAEAIHYAVDNGADLISMSLGARNPIQKVYDAIVYANSKKVTCFVAAGNAGSSKQLLYPAAYSECISIGAVDENSMRADFSCTGPNLDFVAPGVKIFSCIPKSSYGFLSGTSMSCPFALGVAALVLSQKRQEDPNIRLGIDDFRSILKQNTLSIKNLDSNLDKQGSRFWQGMGIINPNEFQEWVEYRTVDTIKKDLLSISDRITLVKNKYLLKDLNKFVQLIASKIVVN